MGLTMVAVVAVGVLCGTATAFSAMLILTKADDGRAFGLHVGDTVLLTLPDDIRPGDGWVLDHYDSKVLEKQTSETRNIPPLNRVDAPTDLTLNVKTKAPGTSELVLKYLKRGRRSEAPSA
jgi:predicted secreted protein